MEEESNVNPREEESIPEQHPKETSTLAVISFILGLFSTLGNFCCAFFSIPCGVVAIILGVLGLKETKNGAKDGRGMAIAGLTLGIAGIIITGLMLVAIIVLPLLLAPQITGSSNETFAIRSLRTICTSQAMFQNLACVDQDQDGTGEYGFLQELSGASNLRGSDTTLNPAYLTQTLAPGTNGIAVKDGYCFYMYLPMRQDFTQAMGEAEIQISKSSEVINGQETRFVCYAWPQEHGKTGNRAFVVDQAGEVMSCQNDNGAYSGDNKPNFDAAFGNVGEIKQGGGLGKDGQLWTPARSN